MVWGVQALRSDYPTWEILIGALPYVMMALIARTRDHLSADRTISRTAPRVT